MSGHGTVETAVEATRLGAFDFVEKPLSLTKLLQHRGARARCRPPQAHVRAQPGVSRPSCRSARSKVTQALREQIQQVAPSGSPVLLLGELGSGRESHARLLHSLSTRAAKPFVMVIAASLGADPAAALFGSVQGGRIEPGAFDMAAGGTLFINGLDDLSSAAQRLLVGAIEQSSYMRVGGQSAAADRRPLGELRTGGLRVAQRRRNRSAATSPCT